MSTLRSLFNKQYNESLEKGIEKSKKSFFSKLTTSIVGKSEVDADLLDELEEILISADVGVNTTLKIINQIEARIAKEKYVSSNDLVSVLREEILNIIPTQSRIQENIFKDKLSNKPYVVMVIGVNGAGKTTSIGKLAYKFSNGGKKVVLGAADTFRAGAIEQLQTWATRTNSLIVAKNAGSDPAAVTYEALELGKKENADIIFIDTAGRLHNNINLMNELSKIKKVMGKVIDDAPHETLLILDGTSGQNTLNQAKKFMEVINVDSLAITKLDGTAKGGAILGICDELKIPLKYIGVGEKIEELQIFDKESFINSFFAN